MSVSIRLSVMTDTHVKIHHDHLTVMILMSVICELTHVVRLDRVQILTDRLPVVVKTDTNEMVNSVKSNVEIEL